ncbi:MAG: hypothetical protein L0216_00220 [Planctomycetales bacterium]|nr:hypothetical protein [Planctomycetales bacterium]
MRRAARTKATPPSGEEPGFTGYQDLMRRRVGEILLVASPYDRFLLEEDGRFSDRIFREYLELNLSAVPRFQLVSTAREAIREIERERYDLVLTTPHCADMSPRELAAAIRKKRPGRPVILLAYDRASAQTYADLPRGPAGEEGFDEVFLWSGNPRLLLALVKSVEDRLNVDEDTSRNSVQVLVVVEDSPVFYSSYLPMLYTEVYQQTQACMVEGLNEADRLYRLRARPKILLARTHEEAQALLGRYREYLLCVVLDSRFPRGGALDPEAGRSLALELRRDVPDLPLLLQSAEPGGAEAARSLGIAFADKNSPDLLATVRAFLRDYCGFGPFIFRAPDAREVARAKDIEELVHVLPRVPDESLLYHAARNHFSKWLMTRCEFPLAYEFRGKRLDDFAGPAEVRAYMTRALAGFLEERQRGLVTDWVRGADPLRLDFTRIGGGSMGGKARGIAFLASELVDHPIHRRHPGVRIVVPRAEVLGTDLFDRQLEAHGLRERALREGTDAGVARLFLEHPLPDDVTADLAAILAEVRYPLAVRSSSLFEDSAYEPLAGLYDTILVPNSSVSDAVRLEQLSRAIRLVWASTFFQGPRSYAAAGLLRLEEEKMAVIVQRLVGCRHGDRFYPDFAGTAQSWNYYPLRYLEPREGIAAAVLGLGQTVVEGGRALRFCPRHPEVLPQLGSPEMALRSTQKRFYALDLSRPDLEVGPGAAATLRSFELSRAEEDGTLGAVASSYDPDDDRIHDSLERPGPRIVTFAPVLRLGCFPLAPILGDLLELGAAGLGAPAEIEFAVSLEGGAKGDGRPEFGVVQLRPLVAPGAGETVDVSALAPGETRLMAGRALGSGVLRGIRDVVYVSPARFGARATAEIASEIARVNAGLVAARRPYLLAGPGRWGTADPSLGVPVSWGQVSGARVIAEISVPEHPIEASQGTHFFHNITSLRIGYFTVDLRTDEDQIDLAWLDSLTPESDRSSVRHVALPQPLEVRIDAKSRRGVAVRTSGSGVYAPARP